MTVSRRTPVPFARSLLMAGTALVAGMLAASQAAAQQVTLTTDDQDVTIQGDLVSFDRGVYIVQTIIGEISISGDNVVCEGPGCPGAVAEADAAAPAGSQDVILTNEEGGIRLEGKLVAFTDEAYTVETIIGRFDIFSAGTLCEGPGCPTALPVEEEKQLALLPQDGVPAAAPTPVVPQRSFTQETQIIPVARTSSEPNLRLAGPASVVAGMLPTLMDQLAAASNTQAALIDPEFLTLEQATTEGVGPGNLGATLSGGGSDTVVLARLKTSSDDALRSLNSGETDLAIVSAPAPLMQLQTRTETVLGNEGLVAIVSPDNAVTNLSPAQMAQVFSGAVTNWTEVGGSDLPIRLMGLPADHDLTAMLDELVLTPNLAELGTPEVIFRDAQTLAQNVAETPGAVAFVGHAAKGAAKDLGVGSTCSIATFATPENIRTARYPFSRAIMAMSFSEDGAAADLLAEMAANSTDIVTTAGLEPVRIDRFSLDGDAEVLRATLPSVTDRFERINISNALRIMPSAERLGTILRLEADGNRLTLRSKAELERVLAYAAENDLGEIFVVGYSHQTNSTETNRSLAQITASAVINAMNEADDAGVLDSTVIRKVSLGAASPMACDDAPNARALNQRAEIWVRRS